MTLKEIEVRVNQMATIIGADEKLLPTYGKTEDFAQPHIEVHGQVLHFVVVERGKENKRQITRDIDELLYWIFSGVTFRMSLNYELKNRDESKDFRRIAFKKQEELMGMLKPEWKVTMEEQHRNPVFDDNASLRAKYFGEMTKKGLPFAEVKKLAYAKYPLPKNHPDLES